MGSSWAPLRSNSTASSEILETCALDLEGKAAALGEKCFKGLKVERIAVQPSTYYHLVFACTVVQIGDRRESPAVHILVSDDVETGQPYPRGHDFEHRCSGEQAVLLFRTLLRSSSIAISMSVNNVQAGTFRVETAMLLPLNSTLSFAPPPGLRVSERVVATLATQPARANDVGDAVLSILPFVDQVRVFCNACDRRVPEALNHTKIEVAFSEDWDIIGDIGRFFWVDQDQPDFDMHFTIDEGILYPPDYVARMVASIHEYGERALIGVHCATIKQPLVDYHDMRSRTDQFFAHSLASDSNVHIIGTGTLAYATKSLPLRYDDFSYPDMADIWVSLKAQEHGLPRVCRQRSAGWLQAIANTAVPSSGISADRSKASVLLGSGTRDNTKLLENYVLRQHFPVVRTPILTPARPKVVFAVTTWNRLYFLRTLIQSFFATKSDLYDWVLIVADDGSTDGTLAYLEDLPIQDQSTEMIIIHNNGSYACGQTNDIFELSLKIGFDYGFKVDDDVILREKGWDTLYVNAMARTPYKHLSYLNLEHRSNLVKVQNLTAMLDPPVVDASGLLLAAVDGWSVDGPFFTYTPEVLQRGGYCDEPNFPIRGQWHVDMSLRYARAGFNNLTAFYDAKGSSDYITLQVVLNRDQYKAALPWGPAYKKTKDPAEIQRRLALMRNDTRVYVPRPRERFPARAATKKKAKAFNEAFELSLYLNLDAAVNRREVFEQRAERAGVKYQRLPAVSNRSAGFSDVFSAYTQQPMATATTAAVRPIKSSLQAYLDYDSQSARVVYWEQRFKRKALKMGGLAYTLSWINGVRLAVQQNAETLVLFDDDAVFHQNFTRAFERVYAQLPDDWMVLYLGAIQYSWDTKGEMAWIVPYSEHLYRGRGSSIGSHAVAIRNTAYPWLLRYMEQLQLPVDDGALSATCHKFPMRCFTALPHLVIQDLSLESSISSSVTDSYNLEKRYQTFRWTPLDYDF